MDSGPRWIVNVIRRLPAAAATLVLFPVIAGEFFKGDTGREYGIGLRHKLVLLARMVRNNLRVVSATTFITHVLMAAEVLKVPRSTPGVLVECGAYKGGSTVNLSLVAALVGRELHVFDSFAGLPEPDADDEGHLILGDQSVSTYAAGDYTGTLDEVTSAVTRYGNADACRFHEGFFDDTMPKFAEPVVLAFLDVDLLRSEETCLEYLWPLLEPGCYLFTDEAQHHEIAQLFYDRDWWQQTHRQEPPGLVGAGSGVGLFLSAGGFGSSLGYTVKVDRGSLPRRAG